MIDTGEAANPAAPVFTAPRHGILVLWAIGARIRGCVVASKPLTDAAGTPSGINAASRAVRMWTLTPAVVIKLLKAVGRPMIPFADATDNVIEQSGMELVEIFAFGEVMFASNRCMNFSGAPHLLSWSWRRRRRSPATAFAPAARYRRWPCFSPKRSPRWAT